MVLVQPQINKLSQYIELGKVHKLAFELMDFAFPAVLDNEEKLGKVFESYEHTDNYSVHGVFIDINYSGGDPLIFEASEKRIIKCIESFKKLHIHRMVLHTCFHPILMGDDVLYDIWCESSAKFLIGLVEKYDIELFIENVLDISPSIIEKLMQKTNHKKIGVCFDVGHANLSKTPLCKWIEVLHPYIRYIHLNDNNGVYDDHLALGDGNIDFVEFGELIKQHGIEADYTLEVTGIDRVLSSIRYIADKELGYVK